MPETTEMGKSTTCVLTAPETGMPEWLFLVSFLKRFAPTSVAAAPSVVVVVKFNQVNVTHAGQHKMSPKVCRGKSTLANANYTHTFLQPYATQPPPPPCAYSVRVSALIKFCLPPTGPLRMCVCVLICRAGLFGNVPPPLKLGEVGGEGNGY